MKTWLFFFLMLGLTSCKKDEVTPTGSVKITITSLGVTASTTGYYTLYTEIGYQKGTYLRTGQMSFVNAGVYQVLLDDLNTGNYVVSFQIGTYTATRAVQVTAGRQRDYT